MKSIRKVFALFIISLIFCSSSCLALTPSSKDFLEGIDVSSWQGYIDYNNVKNQGIDIVYIKSTQGSDYKDPYFELNYENAKLNGLKVGVYHYLTARSITEAKEQARFFASVISNKKIDCKLAMDFESFGELNKKEINEISEAFLQEIEKVTGKEAIVYSDLYNAKNVFELSGDYPLWIAYYGKSDELSKVRSDWEIWQGQQYTDLGKVKGIQDDVDRDLFTSEILIDGNKEIPKISGNQEKNISDRIEYEVKRGDTLWKIAQKYKVTIKEIVNLNNIKNPNLIYPNEKLTIITNTNYEHVSGLGKDFYTVKSGDTLSELAIKFDTTIESIVQQNDIANPNYIYVGQRLRI